MSLIISILSELITSSSVLGQRIITYAQVKPPIRTKAHIFTSAQGRRQCRTEGGLGVHPPRNSEGPSKWSQTQPDCEKLLKIAEFRMPTPQVVPKKSSKILKLPPVRHCFTLAMTNKLVVVINSLKVPKINKILLYEMKFLVPNYSCLQNP